MNQIFTAVGKSWQWDGIKWVVADAGSDAGTMTMITVNTTTTLATGFSGFVRAENTTSASITITLPVTPSAGQTVTIKDMLGNAGIYPITVSGNGKTIEGTTTLTISFNYGWLDLIYTGVQWGQT